MAMDETRLFFSGEKNQKTFMSSAAPSLSGQFHDLCAGLGHKSLFVSFSSEKEVL
jgi:hypothetical protein